MMFLFLFLFFGFGFGFVMNVDGVVFDEQDFYSKYSKSEWVKSSQKQKSRILNDYINSKKSLKEFIKMSVLGN